MRLDQRRRPFSFGLAVSVASAVVVVAAAGSVAGLVLRTRFLTASIVPTWIAIALVVALLMTVLTSNGRRRKKRVFLLIPAFSQKHWLAEFIQNTHHVLDRHGYEMVLHIPAQDYSGPDQARHLIRLLERSADYDGGVIIAAEPEAIHEELTSFCEHFSRPVVFADVRPFSGPSGYPSNAMFVGYGAADIGEKAAVVVARHLAPGRRDPVVLVVGSEEQSGRQRSFAERLSRELPEADITVSSSGRFARGRAREIVSAYLDDTDRQLDVIFCTNDEMALGSIDALNASRGGLTNGTFVLGVDGTDEAVALIRSGGTAFKATIKQDARHEAESAVSHPLKMLNGGRPPAETFLTPDLIPIDADRPRRPYLSTERRIRDSNP